MVILARLDQLDRLDRSAHKDPLVPLGLLDQRVTRELQDFLVHKVNKDHRVHQEIQECPVLEVV